VSLYGDSVLPLADQLKTGEVELELRLLELYELDELLDELELAELELSLLLESLLELSELLELLLLELELLELLLLELLSELDELLELLSELDELLELLSELDELLELLSLELLLLDESDDELEDELLELPAAKHMSQSMKVPSISAGTLVMSARVR